MSKEIHQLTVEETASHLATSLEKGLSSPEAAARLEKHGPNQLVEKKGVTAWEIFFDQFKDFIMWVLIGAALVSGFLKEWIDAGAILTIVIMNAVLGFIQEFRAEKALAALKKLSSPVSKVKRNGEVVALPSLQIVPGDLVLLEAGDFVPADARIASAFNFSTLEAPLTGESTPVEKTIAVINEKEVPLGDRVNMVYMGTSVGSGKASAVVADTGMGTELGKIATMIQEIEEEVTPLQKRLEKLGQVLVFICLGIVAGVFGLGLWRGGDFLTMFMTAVSLAVAAIPEGLPAVVTISLALGVQRMVKRNALIRKLPSVETLGCATVICSDKTGTLTQNEMTIKKIWVGTTVVDVGGVGYSPDGKFYEAGTQAEIDTKVLEEVRRLLLAGTFCNGARLYEKEGAWKVIGDPTEGAILTAAAKAGIWKEKLAQSNPILAEIPFDSDRKKMTVFTSWDGEVQAWIKGAPDLVMQDCVEIEEKGKARPLTKEDRQRILEVNEHFADEALRVIAIGYRKFGKLPEDMAPHHVERGMVFLGLVGMIDPPRPEVKVAVEKCKEAGIRSVMITGDHKNTAVAIARELGMYGHDSLGVTGEELDKMGEERLEKEVERIAVYARVTAHNKLQIVKAWKKRGHVAAMTGDGVNDAAAIKEANIGVAMGITGTDVTKEVSDMVITDDNFASIVNAVEEGRAIYDNIKKFVNYLLSCNVGEVLVILLAMLIGWTGREGNLLIPLTAVQILWMNLVTDGLPALAMGLDPADPRVMRRPPRLSTEPILSRNMAIFMTAVGSLIALGSLFGFWWMLPQGEELARTVAFTSMVTLQLTMVQVIRSRYKLGFFSNLYLVAALVSSFGLQLLVIYTPLNQVFETVPLGWGEWGLIGLISIVVAVVGLLTAHLLQRFTGKFD